MSDFDEIYNRLDKHSRVVVGELVDRMNEKLAKRDAMADWLIGILEPHIRKLIKDELNERT